MAELRVLAAFSLLSCLGIAYYVEPNEVTAGHAFTILFHGAALNRVADPGGVIIASTSGTNDSAASAIAAIRRMYGRSMRAVINAYIEASGMDNHETGWKAQSKHRPGIWKVTYGWGDRTAPQSFVFEYDSAKRTARQIDGLPVECDCAPIVRDPLAP